METLNTDLYTLTGKSLSPRQLELFKQYERELLDWNNRFNLTAISDSNGIRVKHFLDSLACLLAIPPSAKSLIDIGCGAGFPGIPLKIAIPELRLTLVDSVGKKVQFCQHVTTVLHLDKVEVLQKRAEEIGQLSGYREKYDVAVARAVANMPILMEYLLPLVRVGGIAIAMKGSSAPAETHTAERAIRLLGGHLRQLIPIALPGVAEDRYLVIIDKIAACPPQYPRRTGIPSKKPL